MMRARDSNLLSSPSSASAKRLLFAVLLFCLLSPRAHGQQVCTTQQIGSEEFRGISGNDDASVIAVGKKGTIVQFDGSTWSPMTSPTNKDLNDVEVVGAAAFAAGANGTTVQLVGSTWITHTGFTNQELHGVWAASANEAYVVGNKGAIYAWDGSAWTSQNAASGAGNMKLVDAWGDANGFYALGDKGVIYRYDRSTGAWDAPNTLCQGGGGFEDLWGDASGNLYLVDKKDVYLHDGTSCSVVATASENLEGVYGFTATGEVYAVGKKGTVLHYDGSSWQERQDGIDDLRDDWVSPLGNAYYAGKKGEITTCQCVGCGLAEFVINHDGFGINCLDEQIQVDVIDASAGTPKTDYNEQITLNTQTGFGSWGLVVGSGALVDATPNDGLATYDWPLGESSATFALSYQEGTPIMDIDVFQTSDPAIRDNDAEGTIEFSPNGFTLTSTPLTNPPPAVITPFSAPQIAGTDFNVFIAAFGQTPNDPVCGIIESYTGPKNLKFWFDYVDPLSGTISPTIDGASIGTVEATAGAQAVVFTNGQASVVSKYKDAGRIQINVKDDNVADPDLPNGIRGATAGFVVKPDHFELTNIEDGAGNPNPAAPDATGPVFIAAGQPFSVTVTARDAEGDVTPNYGQESIAETVTLTPNLVDPAGGNNPPITAAVGFGPFTAGQATGTDFIWPEVGIISLTPSVGDGSYFDAGDVVGIASGNVGRFIPDHFTTSLNTPEFATSCASGAFTYLGEPFDYATVPVITVTARAAGGATTQNYTGGFFKIDNTTLVNRTYTAAQGTLDTSGLPSPAVDPAWSDQGGGVATLTFSAGAGLSFDRSGGPVPPFDADIQLSIDVIDADGVVALANPVTFGNPGGIAFDNGSGMRYGRVDLVNSIGSELVNLAVPMRAEYFVDAATGFVVHTADDCTNGVTLSLGAFTLNLAPGETCVLDNGSPGDSNEGCPAPGPVAQRYREPPLGGDFNLFLQAPGATNNGSTTVTADVPAWLEFDWDAAALGLEDPTGTATFGIYSGEGRQIYIREIY